MFADLSAPSHRVRPLFTLKSGPLFDDPRLNDRFIDEDRVLTLRNVRNLCWIAMSLVLTASVLDWFAYPQLAVHFFVLRIVCTLCLVPVLWSTRMPVGRRYFRALTIVVPMVPALFISLMIKAAHDPGTGYYAGLTLCLVAIGFMFHWNFVESTIALCLVVIFYVSANAWMIWEGVSRDQFAGFINNGIFILLNGVVIISGSFYHHRIRVREFVNRIEVEQQREELADRNAELIQTLKQLRETESQLVQSEKLASLGRMSAGIIHEINNPLNFTNQALFVLKKKGRHLPENEREHFERIVTDIKDGIGRVSSIVSDLRSFSHPDSGVLKNFDLSEAVQQAARLMAKPLRDSEVDLDITMPSPLFLIGDSNQVIQILINLLQNAVDALKGVKEPVITINVAEHAEEITLEVTDNGCGIPETDIERVFDPFFTTKGVGEGMGLGLSVCYRLMHQMRGSITVHSRVHQGTTFCLHFPSPASPTPLP